jgi:NADH:ubiquinone oxidoreductase subunit 6 (subunit J)
LYFYGSSVFGFFNIVFIYIKSFWFFFIIFLLGFISLIFIIIVSNPIWSSVSFNFFVILISVILSFLDLYFYSIVFIVIYVGAITISFVFLIMFIDFRSIRFFNISIGTILISIFLTFSFLFLVSYILCNSGNDVSFFSLHNVPICFDGLLDLEESFIIQIGFLFVTDFIIPIVLCFLLLLGIVLYIIGFRDIEQQLGSLVL